MSNEYECTECSKRFDTSQGMKCHRTRVHVEKKRKKKQHQQQMQKMKENPVSSYDRTPPIVRYEVAAGIEEAEHFFRRSRETSHEGDRRMFRRRAEAELRHIRKTMQ